MASMTPRIRPRSLAVWLALLVAVLSALVPTLSYGLVRAKAVPLREICTSLGPRWLVLTDSPDSPDGQESALRIAHCPFCLPTLSVAPPPDVSLSDFGVLGQPVVPALGQAFLFITHPAPVPPLRGPPLATKLSYL